MYEIFLLEEAALISSMPISRLDVEDKIIWWPTIKGQFFL